LIKRFILYKKDDITERGKVSNLRIYNQKGKNIKFKNISPVFPPKFKILDNVNYKLHQSNLHLGNTKEFYIKIGFLISRDRYLAFSLLVNNKYIIANPIFFDSRDFLNVKTKLSVFLDGKRKLTHSFIFKNMKILDFYSIIDKIFYDFNYFDVKLKNYSIISFKRR